jgi:hypothetical protein
MSHDSGKGTTANPNSNCRCRKTHLIDENQRHKELDRSIAGLIESSTGSLHPDLTTRWLEQKWWMFYAAPILHKDLL